MIPSGARVLITREQLAARVGELGADITRDYRGRRPALVGVMKGALVFLADLVRAIDLPLTTDLIAASSYGDGTRSAGSVRISELSLNIEFLRIEERHVVLVEDIIDSGRTVDSLRRNLERHHPRSLRICTLLDKAERREIPVDIDYRGFTIPDTFVVGYGMDYGGIYRNLPDIVALAELPEKPSEISVL